MKKNLSLVIAVYCVLCLPLVSGLVFAESAAADYLLEFGVSFYNMGRYEEALTEFKKVLLIDPNNKTAYEYINSIFAGEKPPAFYQKELEREQPVKHTKKQLTREEAINNAFSNISKIKEPTKKPLGPTQEIPELKITGEAQLSLGVTPDDAIWKRANADLNEKNYRMLSETAYDRKTNTYDARIFDRLKLNLDSEDQEGFAFHSNITVDPWSFTGKSPKMTVSSNFGDTADVELKYWSNTGYTINETVFSNLKGNSFALPEIKVNDGKTNALNVNGVFTPVDVFHIPATKIERQFQPVREFWVDYKKEGTKIRFFPIAYQDQALTFDDPLVLSNNHIFWQESPWIDSWQPGRLNSGAVPVDFSKGRFDDTLSYFTRDSDGTRLTALRGLSFEYSPDESTSLSSTFASPKGLWQDYESFDNVINATRFKYRLLDNLSLGSLFTYRLGLNENNKRDSTNYLWGVDAGYEITEGVKVDLETAVSRSANDLTSEEYKSKSRGLAYNFSLIGTFPRKNIMDLKYGYNEIKPEKTDSLFAKYRFYLVRMDRGFNPALSNYRETRDDSFWSRHIHFRKPYDYYFTGLYEPTLSWDDVQPYRIGNGIDIGRDVIGFRLEMSLFDQRLDNLFDVRNVHKADGKFVENVVRDEATYELTDKLTTKILGIYQKLPKTDQGKDPFIFDPATDIYFNNNAIIGGKDPSLKTGSLGLEYAFTKKIALSGIWERTNDSTLAYDNFPRGILNSSSFTTFSEYNKVFRREAPFLYSQDLFPLPPYDFYNIWKAGLRLDPTEDLEIYLDYTRNEFKSAGQIDDNMNHVGIEVSYVPTKKFGLFFRYTYSRWNDINRMLSGFDKIYLGHHNFFTEFRYSPTPDDEFAFQYGESGISPTAITTFDPFGGSLATLATRHIVRMYYRRRF